MSKRFAKAIASKDNTSYLIFAICAIILHSEILEFHEGLKISIANDHERDIYYSSL